MKQYSTLILSSLILVFLFSACNSQPQGSGDDIATPVTVAELRKSSINKLVNTSGTANPAYGAELNAEISGAYRLLNNPRTGKPFKLGDAVVKGQAIISLEDAEYRNGIALDSKALNLEISEQEQSKQKVLYEKGGVTLSEMRNTEVKVTNARYDYENAKLSLAKMTVRAPFNGVIVNLPYYTPHVRVEQGKPMAGVMDYAKMYVDINLPESNINEVKEGQPVYITHYTLPDDTLKGVVEELSPAISMETRTFKGKIQIWNEALKLRPGMFVKADIVVAGADSVIVIPKNVIQTQRNSKSVFIVDRNTAVLKRIKTGLENENNVEVLEGLSENDNLIIKGFETLRENSKVKVQR